MSEIRFTPSSDDYVDLLPQVVFFEHQWDGNEQVQQTLSLVSNIIEQLRGYMVEQGFEVGQKPGLEQLNDALDYFYLDLTFSSTSQEVPQSMLNSLCYVVRFHTGESLSMSILLNHVLNLLGFDCSAVVIDRELMLKVTLSQELFVIVDALSGEQHTHKLKQTDSVLPNRQALEYQMLESGSLLQLYLTQQKMAFTQELHFDKALYCIEMLMQTTPDDPYQRRDRGFVLHQLDCFEHARNDFEFFIDQCPEDPAAQLLKMQLEEFDGPQNTVH